MLAGRGGQPTACMRTVASRTRANLLFAFLLALIALACAASSAHAEPWGEVTHFSLAAGTAPGQVDERGLVKFAAGSDGVYYLLTETPNSGELVLQRFKGAEMQAKTTLEGEKEIGSGGFEGWNAALAVDRSRNRVYVLLVYLRRPQTEHEEEHNPEEYPLDDEMIAAGALYAFEYSSTKKELIKKAKLTRADMKSQGENPKEALLDPRGMAVDPKTGDLAISGNQDEESDANVVEHGTEKQCRAAVQFVTVHSTGEKIEGLSLGARYVDKAGAVLFGETGCGEEEGDEGIDQAPASPVFTPNGTVLGYGEDEEVGPGVEGIIWQLTPAGADEHAAGEVAMAPKELFVAESISTFEAKVGEDAEEPASVMSLVPEGATEGTIYLQGAYYANHQPAPAVLRYSDSGGEPVVTEVGWTAGGSVEPETKAPGPCNLHKTRLGRPIMLGGLLNGSKRGLLALTFYKESQGEVEVPRAEVVEFGEGGDTTGCPPASVTTPMQTYFGEPANTVPAGTPLEISSALGEIEGDGTIKAAASAKSVTWVVKYKSAGGGSSEVVAEEEVPYDFNGLHEEGFGYGVLLKFPYTPTKVGTYEITADVETDNLALKPVKSAVDTLTVTPGILTVRPATPEPTEVRANEQEATVRAAVELPGEETLHIRKVVWEFGDGTKEAFGPNVLTAPATVSVKHKFNRCALLKCKIKVTVEVETTEGSQSGFGTVEIKVTESKAEEAAKKLAEEEAAAKKLAEEEAAAKKLAEEEAAAKKRAEEEANGKGGVGGYIATFTGSSLPVSAGGTLSVRITCPSGGSCTGKLTLQTVKAVVASHRHGHAKKKILTLASRGFSLSGGTKALVLHLNSPAKALLRHSHGVLRAKLTILSRGTNGQKDEESTHTVTLRLASKKQGKRKRHKH
jgi:hypothetical protein